MYEQIYETENVAEEFASFTYVWESVAVTFFQQKAIDQSDGLSREAHFALHPAATETASHAPHHQAL
jgi:hypothetical protein